MTIRTPLCDLLKIDYPILLAGRRKRRRNPTCCRSALASRGKPPAAMP